MQKFTEEELKLEWQSLRRLILEGNIELARVVLKRIEYMETRLIVEQGTDVAQIAWDA